MRRIVCLGLVLAVMPAFATEPAGTTSPAKPAAHKSVAHRHRVHKTHHKSPYGFLPGYEPPEVAEARREREYRESHPYTFYGPAWPRFYHGRWNGGGFGPCYTQTPIGPMWNCGN
jgi:hypothetical protein